MCLNYRPTQLSLTKLSTIPYTAKTSHGFESKFDPPFGPIVSYATFESTQIETFQFSTVTAQWRDSLSSNHPHSTGPLRTSRWHSKSGKVMSPSHWKHPTFPKTDSMQASSGSWATKVSSNGNTLTSPKLLKEGKYRRDIFTAFANTLEVLTSQWKLHR